METTYLKGYVKNLKHPKEVEAVVQGNIKDIKKILNKCKDGSKFSSMHSIFKFDSHALTDEIPIRKEKSKKIFFISILCFLVN